MLGKSDQSETFWEKVLLLEVEEYFEDIFQPGELWEAKRKYGQGREFWFKNFVCSEENKKIFKQDTRIFLFMKFSKNLEIRFHHSAYESYTLQEHLYDSAEPIDLSDVESLRVKVKHLSISLFASGKVKQLKAILSDRPERAYDLYSQSSVFFRLKLCFFCIFTHLNSFKKGCNFNDSR